MQAHRQLRYDLAIAGALYGVSGADWESYQPADGDSQDSTALSKVAPLPVAAEVDKFSTPRSASGAGA